MRLLVIPHLGPRPIVEFLYGGPLREPPAPEAASELVWGDYVFNRDGRPGTRLEWWYHLPSASWHLVERDSRSDQTFQAETAAEGHTPS